MPIILLKYSTNQNLSFLLISILLGIGIYLISYFSFIPFAWIYCSIKNASIVSLYNVQEECGKIGVDIAYCIFSTLLTHTMYLRLTIGKYFFIAMLPVLIVAIAANVLFAVYLHPIEIVGFPPSYLFYAYWQLTVGTAVITSINLYDKEKVNNTMKSS